MFLVGVDVGGVAAVAVFCSCLRLLFFFSFFCRASARGPSVGVFCGLFRSRYRRAGEREGCDMKHILRRSTFSSLPKPHFRCFRPAPPFLLKTQSYGHAVIHDMERDSGSTVL